MDQDTTFVGLDMRSASISMAVADPSRGEVRTLGMIPNTSDAVVKLVRRLGPALRLSFCYEAGPSGHGLHRHLTRLGAACIVAAPSLIPQKPGERVKTDRRDALNLARLLRRGDLTPVWVPDQAHEALRDLSRARHDAVQGTVEVVQLESLELGVSHPPKPAHHPKLRFQITYPVEHHRPDRSGSKVAF